MFCVETARIGWNSRRWHAGISNDRGLARGGRRCIATPTNDRGPTRPGACSVGSEAPDRTARDGAHVDTVRGRLTTVATASGTAHMCEMIASANSLHFTFFAPSIMRAKS